MIHDYRNCRQGSEYQRADERPNNILSVHLRAKIEGNHQYLERAIMGAAIPVYIKNFTIAEQICRRELVLEDPSDVFDPLHLYCDPQRQFEIKEGRAMFRYVAGGIIWCKSLCE